MAKKALIKGKRELCRTLAWPWSTFHARLQMPDCPVDPAGPWRESAVKRLQAWADRKFNRPDDDDLLTGSGERSEWLERYREERYRLARIERLEREGQVVCAAVMEQALLRGFGVLRGVADSLQKRFDTDAGEQIRAGLEDAEREALSVLQRSHDDDDNAAVGTDSKGITRKGKSASDPKGA